MRPFSTCLEKTCLKYTLGIDARSYSLFLDPKHHSLLPSCPPNILRSINFRMFLTKPRVQQRCLLPDSTQQGGGVLFPIRTCIALQECHIGRVFPMCLASVFSCASAEGERVMDANTYQTPKILLVIPSKYRNP